MKISTLHLLIFTSIMLSAFKSEAQKMVGASGSSKIEVIDFHTTHRCKSCLAIEKAARSVVETDFANEVKAGKIIFKTVDVDDSKNAALAEKFEASGTALFVYNGKTGQAFDLADAGFTYAVSNETKFKEYLKTAIRNNLAKL
ncbi:MAG: hypothetical protein IT270_00455 [Saprospiraceae bacterium]|nr:hypothetical protein [Saprospiraceae bacterium]